MNEPSRAVIQQGASRAASALVKALETWTTPYDIKPEGVFGSTATIRSGGVTLTSAALDLEFTVPFDDDMEPNEAEITVYNLSDNTIKQLKKGSAISIEAGYIGDTGVLFQGYITKVSTKYDEADKITTIYAMDDVKDHSIQSLAFAAGTSASTILKTLIGMTGLPLAAFSPRRDYTYKDSQTVDGDLMDNIKRYAAVCGISVYVSKGYIYARYITEGDSLNFRVSPDTGMIGSPNPYEEEVTAEDYKETVNGYQVEMTLQHRMCAGAIVELSSREANGTYRVCSGEHRFSIYECVTSIKMY